MHVHLQDLQVTFVYQGYRVKVKVTGARSVSVCPALVLHLECLDL